jgi:hypothetical protein
MIDLSQAYEIAQSVIHAMEQDGIPRSMVHVVGSMRRNQPHVGDIDLLVPDCRTRSGRDPVFRALAAGVEGCQPAGGLFERHRGNASLLAVRGWKPHFRVATLRPNAMVWDLPEDQAEHPSIDLFRYTPSGPQCNLGTLLAVRTGPADLSKAYMDLWRKTGARNGCVGTHEGWIPHDGGGTPHPCHTEEAYLRTIGIREDWIRRDPASRGERWVQWIYGAINHGGP